ncbi:molybdopterin molybdotransferase MoeA [Verrucomicrobiaceae bacterium N1E253]|uniref:Molybdopterin molybdenumtransferase n=1 Tax=Oceaniferula marina TaxID=2748318 RepID=A0A851GG03_9BACT|nr:molybdopterin molybdotransferase MoeA [Oceaniferula marina]NWK56708.1 molybdopterin molybdotransferase MoeA [Oceaniferula marina]
MQQLITVTEAEQIIQSHLLPISRTEAVSLTEAGGRYLKQAIRADRPLPPFDRVMMDGIAIRHSAHQLGKRHFSIAATQAAGDTPVKLTDKVTCIEVMTGGVLPEGCDCVIPVEEITVSQNEATVRVGYSPLKGQHIHRRGSDTAEGAILVETGQCLQSPELTIAASCGVTEPTVAALPNITLISTGDELVAPEQIPGPHQIRRSHATALRCSIAAEKLGHVSEQHLADDPAQLETALKAALKTSDLLVLTGGVSRGKYDFVAPVLQQLLGKPKFHGIAQRPGKPMAFWAAPHHPPVFALPGNPVSVMACAARYLFPALRQILGGSSSHVDSLPTHGTFNCPPQFTGLIPCRLLNGTLELVPPSNSGNFLSMAGTHGIAEVPGKLTRTNLENHLTRFYPWG